MDRGTSVDRGGSGVGVVAREDERAGSLLGDAGGSRTGDHTGEGRRGVRAHREDSVGSQIHVATIGAATSKGSDRVSESVEIEAHSRVIGEDESRTDRERTGRSRRDGSLTDDGGTGVVIDVTDEREGGRAHLREGEAVVRIHRIAHVRDDSRKGHIRRLIEGQHRRSGIRGGGRLIVLNHRIRGIIAHQDVADRLGMPLELHVIEARRIEQDADIRPELVVGPEH